MVALLCSIQKKRAKAYEYMNTLFVICELGSPKALQLGIQAQLASLQRSLPGKP